MLVAIINRIVLRINYEDRLQTAFLLTSMDGIIHLYVQVAT